MGKKKKKTIKIEVPVPEFSYSSRALGSINLEKAKRFLRQNNKMVTGALIIIVAVAVFSFIPSFFQTLHDSKQGQPEQKVNRTETVTITVPVNISFGEYLDNYIFYSDETITLAGFLLNKIEAAPGGGSLSVHVYYIVDDFGNEIHLIRLNERQKALFVKAGVTEELYNVTGQIRTKFGGFDFEVSDTVLTERPTTKITKQVLIEE